LKDQRSKLFLKTVNFVLYEYILQLAESVIHPNLINSVYLFITNYLKSV